MQERWNEAESVLEACLANSDSDPLDSTQSSAVYSLLAKIALRKDSNTQKAQYYLSRAWQSNDQDANIAFEWGMILLYDSEYSEAKRWFETAERLNPSIDHKLLGKIYHHYKLYNWAAEALEKVRK
jgi:tetratricopeptide (TPR) repeat protein